MKLEKENMNLEYLLKIFKIGAAIVSFLGFVLYFLGNMHNIIYLRLVGLHYHLFPNSIEKNIIIGVVHTYSIIIVALVIIIIIPLIIKTVLILLDKNKFLKYIQEELTKSKINIINSLKLNKISGALLLLLIIILMAFGKVAIDAYDNAISFKKNIQRNDTIYIDNNTSITGKIIICKDSYCGIYDGDKTITIPLQRITRIENNKIINKSVPRTVPIKKETKAQR